MNFTNRTLNIDYFGYYEKRNKWMKTHLEFEEGPLDESLTVKYAALWMNDQIYNLLMEIGERMESEGLYKGMKKHLFKVAWKEMTRYNSLLKGRISVDMYRFAEITQNMEDRLKPDLDRLFFAVSQELLDSGTGGEMNWIIGKLVVVGMLCASTKAVVDSFKRETVRLFGVSSDALDFLYMDRLNTAVMKIEAELLGQDGGTDLTGNKRIIEAFNVLVIKLLDKKMFKEAIANE